MAKSKHNFISNEISLSTPLPVKDTSFNSLVLNASPLLSTTLFQKEYVNTTGEISNDGFGGVLCLGGNGVTLDVISPYMIVMGDSISEGHPLLHGRLHPSGSVGYDYNYTSQPGQLSYELAQLYNIPILNHGIGGQTTQMVRNRWNRDALAIDTNVGDGRGTRTLDFGGQKPLAVYLHCGVNDVFQNTPLQTIKDNFTFFAESCQANNIYLIVSNIGAHTNYDSTKKQKAIDVNSWLVGDFKTHNPEVTIIDYLHWSTDETNNYTTLKPNCFADYTHPNKNGYKKFAKVIYDNTDFALNIESLEIGYSLKNGFEPDSFDRITSFSFNGATHYINGLEKDSIPTGNILNKDNPITTINVISTTAVTNGTNSRYTGISTLNFKLNNIKTA